MFDLARYFFSNKPEWEEYLHYSFIDSFDWKLRDKRVNDEDSDDPKIEYDEFIEAIIVIEAWPEW